MRELRFWQLLLFSSNPMYYVYILYSNKSDLYYVGISTDVLLRLQFHNHISTTSFTAKHRPWTLQVSFSVPSKAVAICIERYIKKRKSRSFVQRIKKRKSRKFIISLINHDSQIDKLISGIRNRS